MFPSLIRLYKGSGETVRVHVRGDTADPIQHALFIALFQPKSESTETKERSQSLVALVSGIIMKYFKDYSRNVSVLYKY